MGNVDRGEPISTVVASPVTVLHLAVVALMLLVLATLNFAPKMAKHFGDRMSDYELKLGFVVLVTVPVLVSAAVGISTYAVIHTEFEDNMVNQFNNELFDIPMGVLLSYVLTLLLTMVVDPL